jgi:OOP family OmpA-OmpF porin
MPLSRPAMTWIAFLLAAVLTSALSVVLVRQVERRTADELVAALAQDRLNWVEVQADGLLFTLSGTAPTESARIRALSVAGGVVDGRRIIDTLDVLAGTGSAAPVFRLEMLRNHDEISVIGLVPLAYGTAALRERLESLHEHVALSETIHSADYPVPPGWEAAVNFGLLALAQTEVIQLSVTAARVEIRGLAESAADKTRLEARLREQAPPNTVLLMAIAAPRPVVSPFALRFVIDDNGPRFDACTADTEDARDLILRAGRAAGARALQACTLALGAPSPRWGRAISQTIAALAEIGAGTVTVADTDIVLEVPHTVESAVFDRVVGVLQQQLPDVFSLSALQVQDPSVQVAATEAAFTAILSDDGQLVLSGRFGSERLRDAVMAYAVARFGRDRIDLNARIDESLPEGWPLRVLAGLEALSELHSGRVEVRATRVTVTGVAGNPDARAQVTHILTDALGPGAAFVVNLTYDESLDPVAQAPTPARCVGRIASILETRKITFAPGSATVSPESSQVLDDIADVMRDCGEIAMEVQGHTDSQGRAESNLALSQARAEAVINALMGRRVLVSALVARGYGDTQPVADNASAEGRESNRRITFALILPETPAELDPEQEAQIVIEAQDAPADAMRPQPRPATLAPARN